MYVVNIYVQNIRLLIATFYMQCSTRCASDLGAALGASDLRAARDADGSRQCRRQNKKTQNAKHVATYSKCIYLYIYTFVYACIHIHMYIYIYVYIYTCWRIPSCWLVLHVYIYMYICIYLLMPYSYINMYECPSVMQLWMWYSSSSHRDLESAHPVSAGLKAPLRHGWHSGHGDL